MAARKPLCEKADVRERRREISIEVKVEKSRFERYWLDLTTH